ncbi:MAG: TRAP transporter substrate-binding protein [Paracoccaceae bacterium]
MRYFAGLIAATGFAAGLSANAETTLRFAHTQPTSDTHHLAAEHFAARVAELTNSEIKISVHPAGELGSDPAILEGLRLGTIDIGQTGNPFYTRFAPKLNVLDLPYLFDSYEHVYKVVDGDIGNGLLDELEQNRMKGLAFWEIGFRNITNSKQAIKTPDDLKGLKIRTTPNPAHVQAFEIWGASPTPMAFTEVYLALETGTVDGQENPVNIIRSNRFQEVQEHMSMTGHAYTVSIVSMNLAKFKSLTEYQQNALVTAAREAAVYQRELNRAQDESGLAEIRAAGVEVIEDIDTAPFRDAVFDTVSQTYIDEHGDEVVKAIEAAR